MLGQAVPWGVNLGSPLTLFVVVVALVVLALTLSTRRSNTRPGAVFVPPAVPPPSPAPPDPQASAWAAAQALFLEDPRAGCAWAEALAAKMLRDRILAPDAAEPAVRRFGAASAAAARGDASTDDLRRAFVEFRALYDSVAAGAPGSNA